MNLKYAALSMLLLACAILMAGCTGADAASDATPTASPLPTTATIPPTPAHCYWDSVRMACSDRPISSMPASGAITTAPTPSPVSTYEEDPILHRWIRQNVTGGGYEFRFYSDGSLVYSEGKVVTVSSNRRIPSPTVIALGTWTTLNNGHYLVKIEHVGAEGAPMVREYALVGRSDVFPVHLVSDYEQADVDTAKNEGKLHSYAEDVFYPELAKTD